MVEHSSIPFPRPAGQVFLVGAGPGDPKLMTIRGLELLRAADVVLYDRLASPLLLAETRPEAERIDVGKRPDQKKGERLGSTLQEEIHRLLIDRAQKGKRVVRLKGGDPFVFGRGREELDACREAGIPCFVVPGVSSALAAPAAFGVPVTHRGVARSFTVLTGRADSPKGLPDYDYPSLARMDTLVLLMGFATLESFTAALLAAGKTPDTPAVAIASATTDRQRSVCAPLASIAQAARREGLTPPVTTLIGPTASFAADLGATLATAASSPDLLSHLSGHPMPANKVGNEYIRIAVTP